MRTLFAPIDFLFSTLTSVCSALSVQFEQLVSHPYGMFGIAGVVVTSLVLAAGCSAWAIVERARRSHYRERVQVVLRRSQIARHFRDSILDSLPERVVVLRSRSQQALSYGGGSTLLQQCLDGPDAAPLAVAVDDLLRHASGFSLSVRLTDTRQVFVRGLRIGTGAALFLRAQESFGAAQTIGDSNLRLAAPPIACTLDREPGSVSLKGAGFARRNSTTRGRFAAVISSCNPHVQES